MLSNFWICLNAVIPLVAYLAVGYITRRAGLINGEEVRRFNHLVFVAFFPPLMFDNIYSADIGEAFDGKLIAFAVVFILSIYFVSIPLVKSIEKNPKSVGAMVQAIYRSNFVLMGLPIAMNVYGKGNVSITATMIMVIVPVYNVLAVFTLEYFRGGKPSVPHMLKKVAQNPIILGALVAIIFLALGIRVPDTAMKVVSGMSDATTPMALVLLGASFNIESVSRSKRNIAICIIGRLIVVPAIGLTIAALIGIRGVAFVSLVAMMAAPAAVSSYTMAEAMDSDGELAGNAVIFGTPLSCLTIFMWLFIFKNMGMF